MNILILAEGGYSGSSAFAGATLKGAKDGYANFQKSVDNLWTTTFNSEVYRSLVSIALFFAVIGILFFTLKLIREWLKDEFSYDSMQSVVITLLACTLLANNGILLKDVVLGLRAFNNLMSNYFLENVYAEQSLKAAYQSVVGSLVARDQLAVEIRRCTSIVDAADRVECLNSTKTYAQELSDKIPLTAKVKAQFDAFIKEPVKTAFNFATLGPALFNQIAITAGLTSLATGIQVVAEVCLLLTGLASPMFISFTLLPGNFKPLGAWIISFLSIGLFRLYHNTMVGLVAVLMTQSEWIGDLTFAGIMAVLSPIIAAALAAGGGIMLFNAFAGVITLVISKAPMPVK